MGHGNDNEGTDSDKDSKDGDKGDNNRRRGCMLVHLKTDVGAQCKVQVLYKINKMRLASGRSRIITVLYSHIVLILRYIT